MQCLSACCRSKTSQREQQLQTISKTNADDGEDDDETTLKQKFKHTTEENGGETQVHLLQSTT